MLDRSRFQALPLTWSVRRNREREREKRNELSGDHFVCVWAHGGGRGRGARARVRWRPGKRLKTFRCSLPHLHRLGRRHHDRDWQQDVVVGHQARGDARVAREGGVDGVVGQDLMKEERGRGGESLG